MIDGDFPAETFTLASARELRALADTGRYRDPVSAAALAREAVAAAETDDERLWCELTLAVCSSLIPERREEAWALLERLSHAAATDRMRCAVVHEQGENRALAGDTDASLELLARALSLAHSLGWPTREAAILSRLGSERVTLGHYRAGLSELMRALRIRQGEAHLPTGVLDDATAWELGTLYGRIAIVYSNLDDGERAITYYREALARFADRFPLRAGRTLYRMGIAAEEHLDDLDEAERYYRDSATLLSQHGSPSGRGPGLLGLGRILMLRGRVAEGEAALTESIEAIESDDVHRQYLADAVKSLGDARLRLGLHREALDCFERAREMFIETQRPAANMAALEESFYEAYVALQDFPTALQHHEAFHRLEMQHIQERTDWRMAELMVQFDTERAVREREISRQRSAELEREVVERKEAQAALARAHAELEEKNKELHDLTIRDALTGVFNRRHLDNRLTEAFGLAKRRDQPLSVMICDIDDFKSINDRFTHATGDEVLRRVAEAIRQHVRQSDLVARFGGEEFVVLFPATEPAEAASACEKLRALIEAHPWSEVARGLSVRLSIGVAALENENDPEELLLKADQRLYRAKAAGKNCVVAA